MPAYIDTVGVVGVQAVLPPPHVQRALASSVLVRGAA